jgi:hypothetical protein
MAGMIIPADTEIHGAAEVERADRPRQSMDIRLAERPDRC